MSGWLDIIQLSKKDITKAIKKIHNQDEEEEEDDDDDDNYEREPVFDWHELD